MHLEFEIDVGTEFFFDNGKNMIICYDFYNRKYWCKYDTKYGYQFHWVAENQVKNSIKKSNKHFEVVFI